MQVSIRLTNDPSQQTTSTLLHELILNCHAVAFKTCCSRPWFRHLVSVVCQNINVGRVVLLLYDAQQQMRETRCEQVYLCFDENQMNNQIITRIINKINKRPQSSMAVRRRPLMAIFFFAGQLIYETLEVYEP